MKKLSDQEKAHQERLRNYAQKADLDSMKNRARSVTVGTAFGGTTEISLRQNNGNVIWAVMQPVEVIELIHQLSANVGCHIQLRPRDDFSSWRDWRVSDEERLHLNGHPPFSSDINPHELRGRILPTPEEQPGLNPVAIPADKDEVDSDGKSLATETLK
jgi:hypothetical protein